jgi:platelet-activating factor acetylhydrolase IB subunit beta/gamma
MRLALLPVLVLTLANPAQAEPCPAPSGTPPSAVPQPPPQQFLPIKSRIERESRTGRYRAIALGDATITRWPRDLLSQAVGMPTLDAAMTVSSETLLWQLDNTDWDHFQPQIVLIHIGAGDLHYPDGCVAYWGMRAVALKSKQVFPNARIILMSIPPRGPQMMQADSRIAAANGAMQQAAASLGVSFFDSHDAFTCNHQTPCALFRDDLHSYSPQGYELLSTLLQQAIAQGRV